MKEGNEKKQRVKVIRSNASKLKARYFGVCVTATSWQIL